MEVAEEAIANPIAESVQDIAERIAHRRQVRVSEVLAEAAEVVAFASRRPSTPTTYTDESL